MMFVTVPPSTTMAFTRTASGSCWRSSPIATWLSAAASPAFTPSSGAAAAWLARPVKSTA